MGVPVVALRGRRLIARTAASILTHLGRPEWVAEDAEHYVAIAAGLAAGREKLASIRAGLRSEVLASPLGQPRLVAADLADALLKTVEQ
jgi:predicted O-linked N-acetylglucosamine transferase (SPINDLY family)